jgi:arginyl-tRNA synthetase
MTLLRNAIAEFVIDVLEKKFSFVGLTKQALLEVLEVPKKLEHGHLAFPVFQLSKALRKAPPQIAQELASAMTAAKDQVSSIQIASVIHAGGYVNITLGNLWLQNHLASQISQSGTKIGHSNVGQNRVVVIDYGSPNVAKPMHIGHLRAIVIGQAIRNLAATQGFSVIGLNHLGDWGVQFGKLAWAYQQWASEYDFANKPFESLYQMYVRFHEEAEKNPELESKGSLAFRDLEKGDSKIQKLWRHFVDISLAEYDRLWSLMGVKHDLVRGESFYNDRLKSVEDLLSEKGLLIESEGAMVVPLGDEMPPCLIRKSDGASLYATRDIASAMYRHDELKADICLYVVGADQTLHFRQVFKVLEMMGFAWAKDLHHIGFGMYRFKEGKMSTRKGRTVFFEDVVTQAVDNVEKLIAEKNPNLENRRRVAEQVGVGAIIFNDLAVDRSRDVEFDWDKVLSFEGDSGPYVQYSYVRCASLVRKFNKSFPIDQPLKFLSELESPEERELIRVILGYEDILSAAFKTFKPSLLAHYSLELCAAFSRFYSKHRILGEALNIEASRMVLVEIARRVLSSALETMNIERPEAM